MPDRGVWVPTNSVDSRVRPTLGVDSGDLVRILVGSVGGGAADTETPTPAGSLPPDGGLGDVEARATGDGGDPADGGRPALEEEL
jgi:NADH-quinone oxidoreductase subunit G